MEKNLFVLPKDQDSRLTSSALVAFQQNRQKDENEVIVSNQLLKTALESIFRGPKRLEFWRMELKGQNSDLSLTIFGSTLIIFQFDQF